MGWPIVDFLRSPDPGDERIDRARRLAQLTTCSPRDVEHGMATLGDRFTDEAFVAAWREAVRRNEDSSGQAVVFRAVE